MNELIKEAFQAGVCQGREKEQAIYWCDAYLSNEQAFQIWLRARLDKCLPQDRDIRNELEKLLTR